MSELKYDWPIFIVYLMIFFTRTIGLLLILNTYVISVPAKLSYYFFGEIKN